MKLNIGSGESAVNGYVNIDFSPNVLLSKAPLLKLFLGRLNVLKPEHMKSWDRRILYRDARKLRYRPDSIELVYSSHFLEHIYFWEAQEFINSCFHFLKKGGAIRLALPDYRALAEKFILEYNSNPLDASMDFNRSLLSYPLEKSELVMFFLNSRFGHVHKWHPTEALVIDMLSKAGFTEVQPYDFQKGPYPNLDQIEHRSESTFYIQARKAS